MTYDIEILWFDNSKCIVKCDRSITREVYDEFSFFTKNYKWDKRFKRGIWDGKIHLLNQSTSKINVGQIRNIIKFCKSRGYSYTVAKEYLTINDVTEQEISDFCLSLNLPFPLRSYQLAAIYAGIKYKRLVVQSATSSGKSLMLYCILRYIQTQNKKILLIVPNITLLNQLKDDLLVYGKGDNWLDDNIHSIKSGTEKHTNSPITISTWQSLQKEPTNFFNDFGAVFVDEVHTAKYTIEKIINRINCEYKIGVSGTPDSGGVTVDRMVLEGIFGNIKVFSTTKTLMDNGAITKASIKTVVLKHKYIREKMIYADEIEYLITSTPRNEFISNLAIKSANTHGNTVVIFNHLEHGEILSNLINEKTDNNVYFISGDISGDVREEIRQVMSNETNCILIGSRGTISAGLNIPNLHSLVFAHPTKSFVMLLQSIGRILRLSAGKYYGYVYDIADDLSSDGNVKNYGLIHLLERLRIYKEEKFSYSVRKISL